jgi:hypothetical protein
VRVARHPINLELALSGAEQRRRILCSAFEEAFGDADQLSPMVRSARAYAGYLSVVEPESPELPHALRLGAQASGAIATLAAAEAPTQVEVGGRRWWLAQTGPTSAAHVDAWRAGFYLACIARERAALDALCSAPIDLLRRSSGPVEDCQYLVVDALQGWWQRDSDAGLRLRTALDASAPDELHGVADDLVLELLRPELELLSWFMLGQPEGLSDALAAALEHHRVFWSTGSRRTDPDGYLALGPLAVASLAHDAGWAIAVESDYLPVRLYRG